MSAMRGFIIKEFRHILRDRQTLAILLLLPVAQVLLFGFALRTDVQRVRVILVDPAPSAATQELRGRLEGSDRLSIVGVERDVDAVGRRFRRSEADQAIVLSHDFARRVERGTGSAMLVISDMADPNTGVAMQAYTTAVLSEISASRTTPPAATAPLRIATRMRFNPTQESANLFIPGLIAIVLTVVSALMSAISLSREKERGTLEVLLASPLRPWQIIAGKVAPYLLLGLANVLSVLAAALIVFDVPLRGSALLLLAESLLFIITSLALGVLIAARTSSQRTAMMGALIGLMMPSTLLSGMIFPLASLPGWVQSLAHLIPAKWFILISRGIMLRGVGLQHLWLETLVLTAMTAVLLVVAVRSFSVRLS